MDFGSYGSSATPPVISDSQKTAIGDLDHVISSTFYYSSQSASVYYKNTSFQGGTVYGIDSNYLKRGDTWSSPGGDLYKKIMTATERLLLWIPMLHRIFSEVRAR